MHLLILIIDNIAIFIRNELYLNTNSAINILGYHNKSIIILITNYKIKQNFKMSINITFLCVYLFSLLFSFVFHSTHIPICNTIILLNYITLKSERTYG